MITSALLYIIYSVFYLITSPLRLLSDATLPSNVTDSLTTAGNYLNIFNSILPIDTIFAIFYLVLGYEVAIFTYKFIMWVIKRFPTQS